jgi:hypothetical protein
MPPAKSPIASSGIGAKAVSYLESRGLPKAAAEGITAALSAESGLKTGATGSEGAYGLAQWLGSRRSGLESFARTKGEAPSSVNAQLEYLGHELATDESGTRRALETAKDPLEATRTFVKMFERPAESNIPAIEKRAAEALGQGLTGGSEASIHAAVSASMGLPANATQSGGMTPNPRAAGLNLLAGQYREQEGNSPLAGALEAKAAAGTRTAAGTPATGPEATVLAQAPPNLSKPAVAPVKVSLPAYVTGKGFPKVEQAKIALEKAEHHPVSVPELSKQVGEGAKAPHALPHALVVAEHPSGKVVKSPGGVPVYIPNLRRR